MAGKAKHLKALKRQRRRGKRAKEARRLAWKARNRPLSLAELAVQLGMHND